MTAYIFCFSRVLKKEKIKLPAPGETGVICIAADSGAETAFELGVVPEVIIGDFDSADYFGPKLENIKKIRHPPRKNDTDSLLAIKYALDLGFTDIALIGGLDARLDHTLANLRYLKYIKKRGYSGYITNGYDKITYLENSSVRIYKNYKYISVLPVSPKIRGVTLTGFKYPLEAAEVDFEEPYTVCNEIAENFEYGEISISDGEAFVCECDERN
ncbi:MAG: thiamine diphosphokinase [Oscillospiraceae bacterium]|nr:thiamine diphosphokinase [Oscillospiraceae bacterium]